MESAFYSKFCAFYFKTKFALLFSQLYPFWKCSLYWAVFPLSWDWCSFLMKCSFQVSACQVQLVPRLLLFIAVPCGLVARGGGDGPSCQHCCDTALAPHPGHCAHLTSPQPCHRGPGAGGPSSLFLARGWSLGCSTFPRLPSQPWSGVLQRGLLGNTGILPRPEVLLRKTASMRVMSGLCHSLWAFILFLAPRPQAQLHQEAIVPSQEQDGAMCPSLSHLLSLHAFWKSRRQLGQVAWH